MKLLASRQDGTGRMEHPADLPVMQLKRQQEPVSFNLIQRDVWHDREDN